MKRPVPPPPPAPPTTAPPTPAAAAAAHEREGKLERTQTGTLRGGGSPKAGGSGAPGSAVSVGSPSSCGYLRWQCYSAVRCALSLPPLPPAFLKQVRRQQCVQMAGGSGLLDGFDPAENHRRCREPLPLRASLRPLTLPCTGTHPSAPSNRPCPPPATSCTAGLRLLAPPSSSPGMPPALGMPLPPCREPCG